MIVVDYQSLDDDLSQERTLISHFISVLVISSFVVAVARFGALRVMVKVR